MSDTLGIGLGVAGTAINQGLGMMNQEKQVKDQEALMEHGANLAYRNWLRTNYGAQREQLEKAGMNVGLMYSQGGQGGQLNSGSSGSASQAPTMDIANAISHSRAVESQMKLQEAQTRDLNATAESKEMDNETKQEFGQAADMYEAENRGLKALNDGYFNFSDSEVFKQVENSGIGQNKYFNRLKNDWTINNVEATIKEEGMNDELKQIGLKTIEMGLDNELKGKQIELTSEQTRKIWHEIWQGWVNAGFNGLGKIMNAVFLKGLGGKGTKTEHYDGSDKSWTKKTITE